MIRKIFKDHDIEITDKMEWQLQRYYELLVEWNKKINLTAITKYEDVIYKHFLDSAFLVKNSIWKESQKRENMSVLDLGTGAGLPGIVLAILHPLFSYTLADSLRKRIDFLHMIKDELELAHISLHHGRAEDLGRQERFRNNFDLVVSRAVAELPVLIEYCMPFVKEKGHFVAYKGKKYQEEIEKSKKALDELKGSVINVEKHILSTEERFLIFVQNNSTTDIKYPRKNGKIKKNPLL